jgi:hypothetical protein
MRKLQAAILLASLASLASLSACGSSDENADLNNANAQQVGGALAAQVTAFPAAFTATDLSTGSVGGGFFGTPALAVARWAAPSVIGGNLLAPCPTVDDATDTDGDGVPDNATFTFTQADCTNGALYAAGTIHIIDPSPTAVGYTGTFGNFLIHFTGQGNDFAQIKLNGTHSVLGTATAATLSENLTTTLDGASGGQTLHGSLTNNWSIQFDPAQGQNIVMDDILPSGDFTAQGTFVYDINGERFSLSIQTVVPLAYDSSCNGDVHPFTAGELRAHLGGPNGQVYVRVTYTACGVEPTVELHGSNA